MPSALMPKLRSFQLIPPPRNITFDHPAMAINKAIRNLAQMFTDEPLDTRLSVPLGRLGEAVIIDGVELVVEGYLLVANDQGVGLTLLVNNPLSLDGSLAGMMLMVYSMQNPALTLPYEKGPAGTQLALHLSTLIETLYPEAVGGLVRPSKAASIVKLSNGLVKHGTDFSFYLASDGMHLDHDSSYVASWMKF